MITKPFFQDVDDFGTVLGMDIFVLGNKYYLLVTDYYSKFPYVHVTGWFCFLLCGNLAHWAYRIEDTDVLDVVGYYYLFNSLAVRIQYNQRGYLKCVVKRTEERNTEERTL